MFQQSDAIVPEVTHAGPALSLQPIGLLEDILTSTTQHQLGAHITSCCLSRCFTAVGGLAPAQRSRAKKREEKVRDSVHWVRGMPNYNHL